MRKPFGAARTLCSALLLPCALLVLMLSLLVSAMRRLIADNRSRFP